MKVLKTLGLLSTLLVSQSALADECGNPSVEFTPPPLGVYIYEYEVKERVAVSLDTVGTGCTVEYRFTRENVTTGSFSKSGWGELSGNHYNTIFIEPGIVRMSVEARNKSNPKFFSADSITVQVNYTNNEPLPWPPIFVPH
jgi:hypothetical protein